MKSRPDLKFEFTKRRCCRMYGPLGAVHTMASIIMANRINPENMTSNLS